MLTGTMPTEHFPNVTECQGSEDVFYTKHTKYKIFPCVFLTNLSGSKPSSSSTKFEKATTQSQDINAGIFINDKSCPLNLRSSVKTRNYITARYTGKIPMEFYGPKTGAGEHFKLVITNNDLDNRYFAKENDLYISNGSMDKSAFYK